LQFIERYKGYLVPIAAVKGGSLLQKLADREQTTSDDILHYITKSNSQEQKDIGPSTSPEELLEVLDLAIDSEGDDLDDRERQEPGPVYTQGETTDGDEALVTTLTKRKRRTRGEIEAGVGPRFVELTKLLPPVPKKGTFEVNAVKKSLYFFS
jgi:DNA-directed RNA polymerase